MRVASLAAVTFIAFFAAPVLAEAPSAPYAGQQVRQIKALSAEDIAALLNGEGMGLAKPAELNGYPGPRHVLDLASELKLTAEQRRRIQIVFERMSAAAKQLGAELVERERQLDQQFARGGIDANQVGAETATIGALQALLRATHLAAHLETKAVLDPDQIARYQQLRGYDNHAAPGSHRHG